MLSYYLKKLGPDKERDLQNLLVPRFRDAFLIWRYIRENNYGRESVLACIIVHAIETNNTRLLSDNCPVCHQS